MKGKNMAEPKNGFDPDDGREQWHDDEEGAWQEQPDLDEEFLDDEEDEDDATDNWGIEEESPDLDDDVPYKDTGYEQKMSFLAQGWAVPFLVLLLLAIMLLLAHFGIIGLKLFPLD